MPVTKEGGELLVAGNVVSDAGWYTFRQTFKDEDGHLAADFALVQNDQPLFTQELTTTAFSEEEISSYETSNVGTGYSWFVSLSEGLSLAIDEHGYVPGAAMGEMPETMPEAGAGGTFSQSVALLMAGALLVLGGLVLAAQRRRRNTESGVA